MVSTFVGERLSKMLLCFPYCVSIQNVPAVSVIEVREQIETERYCILVDVRVYFCADQGVVEGIDV